MVNVKTGGGWRQALAAHVENHRLVAAKPGALLPLASQLSGGLADGVIPGYRLDPALHFPGDFIPVLNVPVHARGTDKNSQQ